MPNIVDNTLYVEGPTDVVDRFIAGGGLVGCSPSEPEGAIYPDWRNHNWGSKWLEVSGCDTIREMDGIKTVVYYYTSAWSSPFYLLHHAVRKYHDEGLRFFSSWTNGDFGLHFDPLFGNAALYTPASFGENYTKNIIVPCDRGSDTNNGDEKASRFKAGTGLISIIALDRSGGFADIYKGWFSQRGYSEAQIAALTGDQITAAATAAYPDHILLNERFAAEEEVLMAGEVVNRRRFFNDLLFETWGEAWFQQCGIAPGNAQKSDLTADEYDKLICDAYPALADGYLRDVTNSRNPTADRKPTSNPKPIPDAIGDESDLEDCFKALVDQRKRNVEDDL